jgi:hypothetical protein
MAVIVSGVVVVCATSLIAFAAEARGGDEGQAQSALLLRVVDSGQDDGVTA